MNDSVTNNINCFNSNFCYESCINHSSFSHFCSSKFDVNFLNSCVTHPCIIIDISNALAQKSSWISSIEWKSHWPFVRELAISYTTK